MKQQARRWHLQDGLKLSEVCAKLKKEMGVFAPDNTVCSWWSPKVMKNVNANPPDRFHVNDTRVNPKQRPTVLVDTEKILARKVIANMSSGVPFTNNVISILAIKIFHTLIGLDIYNEKGERKSTTVEISDEISKVIQYPMHHSRHLAHSSPDTEYHKSFNVARNSDLGLQDTPRPCTICDRIFKTDFNLILHVYWHAYRKHPTGTASTSTASTSTTPNEHESDDDISGENEGTVVKYNFGALAGWI